MSVLRRIALGFPVSSWSHQRAWCVDSLAEPGARRYFIEWNPDDGVYGEDFDAANNEPCAQTTSGFLVIPPNNTREMSVAVPQQDCGNRIEVAPVIAGGTDDLAWSTVVNQ